MGTPDGISTEHLGNTAFSLFPVPCSLGSENRDRGGIQWYSDPTSAPGALLKININYEGCSGLSNALKTASGPAAKIATLRPEMMQRARN